MKSVRLQPEAAATVPCKGCKGNVRLKVPAAPSLAPAAPIAPPGFAPYEKSPGHWGQMALLSPSRVVTLSPDRLFPAQHHFNCSVAEFEGRLLLAYRTGRAGSHLHVAELDPDALQPVSTTHLSPRHPLSAHGREDPRLFVHRGRLHVAYIGVSEPTGDSRTRQLVALLAGPPWRVERAWAPDLEGGQPHREKNWVFFEWEAALWAVYRCGTRHEILAVRGNRAVKLWETEKRFPWHRGEPRGGASPVPVGDEYYHWFHGTEFLADSRAIYTAGVYTFEAAPPFRVRRVCPVPLLEGDADDVQGEWRKRVVFPCGAVLRGDQWLVSYGWNDRECRLAEFNAAEAEKRMVAVQ